jgi:PBP1b-binding outer membrane lipoprotein LpoB
MEKILNFLKKYKIYILSGLLLIFFFRSCSKSTEIKKLNRTVENNSEYVDSLKNVINVQSQKLDSIPEMMRTEKINIHLEYDSWISERDRSQQLMELHKVVKDNIKELQK